MSEERDGQPGRRRVHVVALAGAVLAVDQATKLWATTALADAGPVPVLGDLVRLRLTYNPGAAFSMGAGFTWVFTIATAVAVVVMLRIAWRVRSRAWAVAFGLLLGGATTHLLDRLARAPAFGRGHVVDFIDYAGLFVGNVADIALTVGAALMFVLSLRGVALDGRRAVGSRG